MTVSEQIIQVIDSLCEKFGIAINWTGENVIPYVEILCKKLITYEVCTSAVSMLFSIVMIVGCTLLIKKFFPTFRDGWKRDLEDYNCGWIVTSIFASIGLAIIYMVSICDIYCQTTDIIKCLTFPEMYVFEYVSNLIQE